MGEADEGLPTYTSTRHSQSVRSLMKMTGAIASVELGTVSVLAFLFLPGWWRASGALVLLGLWGILRRTTGILRSTHHLDASTLRLRCGPYLDARIPLDAIEAVDLLAKAPACHPTGKAVTTYQADDTAYAFTRPKELVQISCRAPVEATLRGRGTKVRRVVVNVDYPDRFLDNLRGAISPAEASPRVATPVATPEATPAVPLKAAAGESSLLRGLGTASPGTAGQASGGLVLSGITKRYGQRVALSNLDLVVSPGEIHGLLGRNGAGKTTTVAIATGLLAPDSGTVWVGSPDNPPQSIQAKRLLGFVPDTPVFFERLSGYEFLAFVGSVRGITAKDTESAMRPLTERLELERWIDDPIQTYSLGTRQKLSIVAALLHGPGVLVCDEFGESLDAVALAEVRGALKDLRDRGAAILLTTHILSLADSLCDSFTILKEGTAVAQRPAGGEALEDVFLRLASSSPDTERGNEP